MGRPRGGRRAVRRRRVQRKLAEKRHKRNLTSKRKKKRKLMLSDEESVRRKQFLGEALYKRLTVKLEPPKETQVSTDNMEGIQTID